MALGACAAAPRHGNYALYAMPSDRSWTARLNDIRKAAGLTTPLDEPAHITVVYGPPWDGKGPEVPDQDTIEKVLYPALRSLGWSVPMGLVKGVDVWTREGFFVVKVSIGACSALSAVRFATARLHGPVAAALAANKAKYPDDPRFDMDDQEHWAHMTIAVVKTAEEAEAVRRAAADVIQVDKLVAFGSWCVRSPVTDTIVPILSFVASD